MKLVYLVFLLVSTQLWADERVCLKDSDGEFIARTVFSSSNRSGGGHQADSLACMKQNIRELVEKTKTRDFMSWNQMKTTGFEEITPSDVEFSQAFKVSHERTKFFITGRWKMLWLYKSLNDNQTEITYEKYVGTSHIPHWQGKMIFTRITDNVTAVEIHNEFQASNLARARRMDVENAVRDLIDKLQR